MKNSNSTAITIVFYSAAVLISMVFSIAIILTLDWPAAAEIPLCISIFIQLAAISKTLLVFMERTQQETVQEVYSRLKGGIIDPGSQEN